MTNLPLTTSITMGLVLPLFGGCAAPQPLAQGKKYIVLVGHGIVASDYPKERLREWSHGHEHDHSAHTRADDQSEHARREREIREWPRTARTDPYKFAVESLAERLTKRTGHPVLVAFNEFCSPTLEEAIDDAVNQGAERVVVITTMMTPGGAHSEVDIPEAVEAAAKRHPTVEIVYAWPYDPDRIAATFADQTRRFDAR